jgi:hypothetical protein
MILRVTYACVVYVCLCVCAYRYVRVEIPNLCVEAPKQLQLHLSHASTLESKSKLWMSFGLWPWSHQYTSKIGAMHLCMNAHLLLVGVQAKHWSVAYIRLPQV